MNDVVVNANPLSSGTPVAAALSAITGMDQGTVAAKLDAEIRDEENRRMMNPSAFPELDSPYEVTKTSMKNVRAELLNPEMDLSKGLAQLLLNRRQVHQNSVLRRWTTWMPLPMWPTP